jgi:hypothetical protein
MRFRLLAPFALALFSMAAAAQLYSWKDASGKVHYSDTPPPDSVPVRKVAPPATSAGDASARRPQLEQEAAARKKQKETQEAADKAAKDKADAEERRTECERARAGLQAIESGQTRFTFNAKGERVALEGDVREAELANARKAVNSWCK